MRLELEERKDKNYKRNEGESEKSRKNSNS